ncbi:MAG: ABC transporter permease [Anaerolineales bacterium]|nr:ABC transporter permease [Anaerolineales bacterium]
MGIFLRSWSIIVIAIKRLISQRGLMLASTLGLATAVSLTLSIPLYADAIYYRIFEKQVSQVDQTETSNQRPPFSFVFHYNGGWYGNKQWEDIQLADTFFQERVGNIIGLPQQHGVRYFRTEPYPLFTLGETNFSDDNRRLALPSFAFMSGIEEHITILEGNFPTVAAQEGPIEVLISEEFATELGLQVGEEYQSYIQDETDLGTKISTQIPVRLGGVWKPKDPLEDYWIFNPNNLSETFIIAEGSFSGRISNQLPDEIYSAIWFLVMDGSDVHSSDAKNLLIRITSVQRELNNLLPDTKLSDSPQDALIQYRESSSLLTILLYAFAVPIIGLILAFIGLVAGLSVERQRNEIAVLRSRGGTMMQIFGIVVLQSLILGIIALAISSPLALLVAQVIGNTRSFLDFSAGEELRVGLTTATLQTGLITVSLALIAQVVPAISAARHTIVSYKLEQARLLRPPWWQRIFLDVMLFIPAAYGTYLLREQGSLVTLDATATGDPFQNPLLFIVPALGIFSLTLFILRLIPPIMAAIAWIASHTKGVGLLLAARHLSRTPGSYSTPLILLVLTLSLSAFTASLAQTLDTHLNDQYYYNTGADFSFYELGESANQSSNPYAQIEPDTQSDTDDAGPRWLFFPVYEYLKVPGVKSAARVGRFTAVANVASGLQSGEFIGVDRIDFTRVAFWRKDFASADLGTLMNALAVKPDGVLVPREFMEQHQLRGGDILRLDATIYGYRFDVDLSIVGSFELFPTWYPSDGPLFVGNLDYIYEQAGSQFPYEVWLSLEPGVDIQNIGDEGLSKLNVRVMNWKAAQLRIENEQGRPERQGLFGLLSIGFGAAAILTVFGFLLYALFSFRRRFIELGVLRASGLSSGQMTSFLAWELIFLIGIGGGAGTALGAWVSNLFIPYLQIGADVTSRVPPYLVEIAWPAVFQIYALFGFLFLVTLIILVILLRRMRIFEAIKLGETV